MSYNLIVWCLLPLGSTIREFIKEKQSLLLSNNCLNVQPHHYFTMIGVGQ